ncbi:MAG TPA: hypothetical protein VMZ05_00935 [Spirochaetota bacterium]|nr:hypothetical protein [Spirochaetota bacterium]
MKIKKFLMLLTGVLILISFAACKPINLFSPFVDPSLMGTDAKLDAGYNAIASGDYQTAIDYFTDVIDGGTSGDDLTDAYIGRAAAYMNEASPTIDDVVADVLNGTIAADNQGEIINQVVQDGEYDDFYDNVQSSADDYNNAIDNTTGDVDPGILFEAYQANMMAATGVASQRIALDCNVAGWGPLDVTLNEELDAIADETSGYTYHIGTWSDSTPAVNGLRVYVEPDATAKASMMGYLTNAFEALDGLEANPPTAMDQSDILDMKTGVLEWAFYGLADSSLGTP